MKKNNIFLTLLALLLLVGCSTYDPKYREGEPTENFAYPKDKKIEKSFYLLGDGGYSPPGGISEGLIALKNYMDSVKVSGNYALLLGDNIYPVGMPPKDSPDREASEYRLDAQLDAFEQYDGKVVVIPGNHDWYNEGIRGLEREKEYLESKLNENLIWTPKTGCGMNVIEISENIELITLDSQWFLEDWDKHPTINDNCSQIKTREALFLELASELQKNQNKTIIIALHHPLYTNGVHGGQYEFTRHIYPSQKRIPIPILGSLAALIRTSGGVSIQDAQNERYKSLVRRLETIAQGSERLIFVSGHEHSLQYIEHDSIKQIVAGSGSKGSYAVLSNDGYFAYPDQGFAVYDVFEDGSSWASFYGNKDNKAKLLYQKEVFAAPKPYDVSHLPTTFPATITTSIYEQEETDKTELYKSVWGQRYRELYGKSINVQVAILDTLYGGLKPVIKGGGHQTISIRLEDSLGRDYNMRRLKKSAVQFLQAVAYKDTPVQDQLENTIAENVIEDFYTAAHPYAFLAVPKLSDAIGLYHTNPKLFYVPKQKALEEYNTDFGDELYMIVERPEDDWTNKKSFGENTIDILSTSDMLEKLRKDEKYFIDEPAYVKARVFDMLIGDWDRHQDQWRWAEMETSAGDKRFLPIPRDRDQAFSNFDGAFFGTLRGLTGFANQFAVYGDDIKDVKWFNTAATGMDRSLLQNVSRDTWIEQAKFIQENMTDEVIENAFLELPEITRGETTDFIVKSLKGRRENIVEIATRYYDYMAKLAIVTGTDKDDYIEIERLDNNQTKIIVSRIKDGKKADLISEKIYNKTDTDEIWIYALDDDDVIHVRGAADKNLIFVRVIGGQNNDIYNVAEDSGRKVKIYDYLTKPSTVESQGNAKLRFRDNYMQNTFDKDKKTFKSGSLTPGIGYNPDDGLKLGIQRIATVNGFKRNPFTTQSTYQFAYYFGTNSFDLSYQGEFAQIWGNFNLLVGANYSNPNSVTNFFGYGNETPNYDQDLDFDYNRAKIEKAGIKFGFVRKSPFGSYFGYLASFEGIKVKESQDRFIAEEFNGVNPEVFDRNYFGALTGTYRYESYDKDLNPSRGMKFELIGGGKINLSDPDRYYGYINPYLGFYNAVSKNRKLVVKSQVQAQFNIGDDYEFYQAAQIGADTGLRGYRQERFSGKTALATGADLRYSFNQFKTSFLPFQIGIYGGFDLGRVWNEEEDSKVWHDSYGGGLWINSAEALSAKFSVFGSEEDVRFNFGFGFKF